MVDHLALVIVVFSGEAGGTKNTIEFAYRKCIDIDSYLFAAR